MFKFVKPAALILAALLGLSGCTSLITGGDAELYDLTAVKSFDGLTPVEARLLIGEPMAKRALDTDRMAVRPRPQEYQYLADARFADRVPSLMQSLLVESFENSNAFTAVARTAMGIQGEYVLKAEIRAFEAAFYEDEERPSVTARLAVALVKLPSLSIVASRSFEATAKADGNDTAQIVSTYDMAAKMVIKEVVGWSVKAITQNRNAGQ